MPVSYEELDGYPIEKWDGGFTATRMLKCAWGDRYTLVDELSGSSSYYPYLGTSTAYPASATIRPFGKQEAYVSGTTTDTRMAQYDYATVEVNYSLYAPRYNLLTSKFISEYLGPWTEFLTADPSKFTWTSGSNTAIDDNEAFGKLSTGLVYILTFHHITTIPDAAYTLCDYCNASTVDSYTLGKTFPAQSLLYALHSATRDLQLGKYPSWRLSYVFRYRPVSWNYRWNAGLTPPAFAPVYVKGTSTQAMFHPTGDFSTLTPT